MEKETLRYCCIQQYTDHLVDAADGLYPKHMRDNFTELIVSGVFNLFDSAPPSMIRENLDIYVERLIYELGKFYPSVSVYAYQAESLFYFHLKRFLIYVLDYLVSHGYLHEAPIADGAGENYYMGLYVHDIHNGDVILRSYF